MILQAARTKAGPLIELLNNSNTHKGRYKDMAQIINEKITTQQDLFIPFWHGTWHVLKVPAETNTRILSNDLLYNGRLYNIKNVFSAESTAWKWIYKEISAAATDFSLNDLINA